MIVYGISKLQCRCYACKVPWSTNNFSDVSRLHTQMTNVLEVGELCDMGFNSSKPTEDINLLFISILTIYI